MFILSSLMMTAILGFSHAISDVEEAARDNCMLDNYRLGKQNKRAKLDCKRADFTVDNVDTEEAFTCTEGETVKNLTITASFTFNVGRYDFGWMVALDGGDALTGNCTSSTFLAEDMKDNLRLYSPLDYNSTVGHLEWKKDKNGKSDSCGDIIYKTGGQGTLDGVILLDNMDVPCTDENDDSNMDINVCFSWRNAGKDDDFCNVNMLHPGKATRCLCMNIEIPTSTVVKESYEIEGGFTKAEGVWVSD